MKKPRRKPKRGLEKGGKKGRGDPLGESAGTGARGELRGLEAGEKGGDMEPVKEVSPKEGVFVRTKFKKRKDKGGGSGRKHEKKTCESEGRDRGG